MRTRIKYPLAVVIAAGAVAALGQAAPACGLYLLRQPGRRTAR